MERAGRHTFTSRERLKTSRDFRHCIREGRRAVGRFVVVYLLENSLGVTRLGAGSTRRIGKAHDRNRAKRLVREAFRLSKSQLPAGADLVVLPKVPWGKPTLEELRTDLVETTQGLTRR